MKAEIKVINKEISSKKRKSFHRILNEAKLLNLMKVKQSKTKLNMLFSPTLLAENTLEVLLKMKFISNMNAIADH